MNSSHLSTSEFYILEKSWLAKIASFFFKGRPTAMVLGKTIHLCGVSAEVFLSNRRWLLHELEHIKQFGRYGMLPFLFMYLVESVRKGYYYNRFEVEARQAENGIY
ncbi:MAG: hypothetical protein MUF42_14650 [Cytophagaceae bacterium]|jgi:hypothetical protein|nr:hypothetical protein [Cytophagaceae bacterium]